MRILITMHSYGVETYLDKAYSSLDMRERRLLRRTCIADMRVYAGPTAAFEDPYTLISWFSASETVARWTTWASAHHSCCNNAGTENGQGEMFRCTRVIVGQARK